MPSPFDSIRSKAPWAKDMSDEAILKDMADTLGMPVQDVAEHYGFATGKNSSAMGAGLKVGLHNLGGLGLSALGAGADMVGARSARDWLNAKADEQQTAAQIAGRPDLDQIENVWDHPSKWPGYIGYQAMQQVPQLAGAIGMGLIAPEAVVPAALSRGAAFLPKVLGGGGMRVGLAAAGDDAVAQFAAKRAALAAGQTFGKQVVGGAAFNELQSLGSLYQEAVDAGRPDASGEALFKSLPYALSETLPEAMLAGRFMHGSGLQGNALARMGKSALVQGTSGATSESLQNELEMSMHRGDLTPEQIFSKRLNAPVAGGLVEGLFGGLGGYRRHAPLRKDTPANLVGQPSQEKQTEAQWQAYVQQNGGTGAAMSPNEIAQSLAAQNQMMGLDPNAPPPSFEEQALAGYAPPPVFTNGLTPGALPPSPFEYTPAPLPAAGAAAKAPKGKTPKAAAATTASDPHAEAVQSLKTALMPHYLAVLGEKAKDKKEHQLRRGLTTFVGEATTPDEAVDNINAVIQKLLEGKTGGKKQDRHGRVETALNLRDTILGVPMEQREALSDVVARFEGAREDAALKAKADAAAAKAAAAPPRVEDAAKQPGAVTITTPPAGETAPAAAPAAEATAATPPAAATVATPPAALPAATAAPAATPPSAAPGTSAKATAPALLQSIEDLRTAIFKRTVEGSKYPKRDEKVVRRVMAAPETGESISAIASEFNVSPSRISQLKAKALEARDALVAEQKLKPDAPEVLGLWQTEKVEHKTAEEQHDEAYGEKSAFEEGLPELGEAAADGHEGDMIEAGLKVRESAGAAGIGGASSKTRLTDKARKDVWDDKRLPKLSNDTLVKLLYENLSENVKPEDRARAQQAVQRLTKELARRKDAGLWSGQITDKDVRDAERSEDDEVESDEGEDHGTKAGEASGGAGREAASRAKAGAKIAAATVAKTTEVKKRARKDTANSGSTSAKTIAEESGENWNKAAQLIPELGEWAGQGAATKSEFMRLSPKEQTAAAAVKLKEKYSVVPKAKPEAKQSKSRTEKPAFQPYDAATLKQELLGFIRSKNPRLLNVVQSVSEIPEAIRKRAGATNTTQGFVIDGKAWLIADNINRGDARGVFLHEIGAHLGLENILTSQQFDKLVDSIVEWAGRNDGSNEYKLAVAALKRVAEAKTSTEQYNGELVAYFIEEAVNAGINPTAMQYSSELGRWFRTVWAAFKTALHRLGISTENMTAEDVVNLAYGAARLEMNGVWHGTAAQFRRFNHKFMGTGEGAQVYGWGTYLAEHKGVAREYWRADQERKNRTSGGNVMRVDYAATDDELLDLDAPMSKQGSAVREHLDDLAKLHWRGMQAGPFAITLGADAQGKRTFNLKQRGNRIGVFASLDEAKQAAQEEARDFSPKQIYGLLIDRFATDKAASEYLDSLGIKGLRYFDEGSRDLRSKATVKYVGKDKSEFNDFFVGALQDYDGDFDKAKASFVKYSEDRLKQYDDDYYREQLTNSKALKREDFDIKVETPDRTRNIVVFNDKNIQRVYSERGARKDDLRFSSHEPSTGTHNKSWFPYRPTADTFMLGNGFRATPIGQFGPIKNAVLCPVVAHNRGDDAATAMPSGFLIRVYDGDLLADGLAPSKALVETFMLDYDYMANPEQNTVSVHTSGVDGSASAVISKYKNRLMRVQGITPHGRGIKYTKFREGTFSTAEVRKMFRTLREMASEYFPHGFDAIDGVRIGRATGATMGMPERVFPPETMARFSVRSTGEAVKLTKQHAATLGSFAQRFGFGAMLTNDLGDLAAHIGFPEVRNFVRANYAREGTRMEFERPVSKVLDMYNDLPPNERGIGPGSVNDFIFNARMNDSLAGLNNLSAKGQALVKAVFQHNKSMLALKKKLIEQSVNDEFAERIAEETDPKDKAALVKERDAMLARFAKLLKLEGSDTYAPLHRYGDYMVVMKSAEYVQHDADNDREWLAKHEMDGAHYQVHFVETQGAANALKAELDPQFQGGESYAALRVSDPNNYRDLFRAFPVMRRKLREKFPMPDGKPSAMERLMGDLYLNMLAENNARQAERHAKKVVGASTDMLRAFVTRGNADAQWLASLQHTKEVQAAMQAMNKGAERNRTKFNPFLNEMLARHALSMQVQSNRTVDKIKRMTSLWMLSTSPAFYLQQIVQPWTMSLPVIAGQQGYFRTSRALMKGYEDVRKLVEGLGVSDHIDWNKAPEDVRKMLHTISNNGAIDVGNQIEQGEWQTAGLNKASATWNRVDRFLRGMNTRVESINRAVTAMAAYRSELLRNGGDEAKATQYAEDMVRQTHGSYDGSNTPRYMRHPVGQVMTQFRRFQIVQLSLIGRLAHNALKGEDADTRRVARKALTYTLLHTAAVGGALGMPAVSQIAALVSKVFGDPDEPDDAERKMREAIGDQLISDLLLKGVPAALGVDVSSKMGMANILSFAPFADFPTDRKSFEKYALAVLGGPAGGLAAKAFDGMALIYKGDVAKGIEQLLPNGFANAMKGVRFANEGVTMRNGDVVMKPEDVSALDAFMQGISLPNTKLTHRQDLQQTKYETDTFYHDREARLKNKYAKAVRDGDADGIREAREDWTKLQEARVRLGYTRQPMSTLLRAPQEQRKRERNTVDGVEFTKQNRKFVQEQATYLGGGVGTNLAH